MVYKSDFACNSEGCLSEPAYCIEWFGLNQHGKNPIVVMERYSCDNSRHLIASSQNNVFGGYPDEIQNTTHYEAKPKLLTAVKMAMDGKLDPLSIDHLVVNADPNPRQLRLGF